MKIIPVITLCVLGIAFGEWRPTWCSNGLYDLRDGRCYRIVKIGSQIWMAENLTYRESLQGRAWLVENVPGYWKIAVFYTWNAAMGACPDGWRLPSVSDWKKLFRYVSGESGERYNSGKAIRILKCEYGWDDKWAPDKVRGTDDYGFCAFPVGVVWNDETRVGVGGLTNFWTSKSGTTVRFPMTSDDGGFDDSYSSNGLSVRCIKDY